MGIEQEVENLWKAGFTATQTGLTWSRNGVRLTAARVYPQVAQVLGRVPEEEEIPALGSKLYFRERMEAKKLARDTQLPVRDMVLSFVEAQGIECREGQFWDGGRLVTPDQVRMSITEARFDAGDKTPETVVASVIFNLGREAEKDAKGRLLKKLRGPGEPNPETLQALVARFLETRGVTEDVDVAGAAVKHWLWQVKRKAFGLPVRHPLFLSFYGAQGKGKDESIKQLEGVFKGFYGKPRLEDLTDSERNFRRLTEHYVLHLEEPVGRDESRMLSLRNDFKRLITADTIDARMFHTQTILKKLPMTWSGIASTNDGIGWIIGDPTGMRRFFELEVKAPEGEAYMPRWTSEQWEEMFHHTDESDDLGVLVPERDAEIWEKLQAIQATYRSESPAEEWLRDRGITLAGIGDTAGGLPRTAPELFADFVSWARESQLRYITPRTYWVRAMMKKFRTQGEGDGMLLFEVAKEEEGV